MRAMADGRLKDNKSDPSGNEPLLTYELTYKDVVDILTVIDSSACRELHIERGDFKLTVVKRGHPVPSAAALPPEPGTVERGKGVSTKQGH
jgi:hypothetical protein